jgi:hypothetical protein
MDRFLLRPDGSAITLEQYAEMVEATDRPAQATAYATGHTAVIRLGEERDRLAQRYHQSRSPLVKVWCAVRYLRVDQKARRIGLYL